MLSFVVKQLVNYSHYQLHRQLVQHSRYTISFLLSSFVMGQLQVQPVTHLPQQ